MREIKFRVYDTVNKCFISDMSNFWINPSFTAMMEWRPEFDGQMTFDLNDSLIFQQYTGLKDKNGVEIYEGDLCVPSLDESYSHLKYEIECRSGCFWFGNIPIYKQISKFVVGNIFEGVDNR